ncbi:MAG: winged helix DNA-binding domain-containing protein [Ornithinimicrobium sp.]
MSLSDSQRRRLLGARHLLAPSARTDDVAAIARALVALHSTDPVSVYLSVLARMRHPDLDAVADQLYSQRSLIRHHAMRTTLWVAPIDTVAVMHQACTVKIADVQRRRTEKFLADSGVADPGAWLQDAKDQVRDLLAQHSPISSREIGRLLPDIARPLVMAEGKPYAGTQGAHSRVLAGLAFDGVVVRTRPAGTWIGAQYAWALMRDWSPEVHEALSRTSQPMATPEAQTRLAALWLSRFGPGTERDLSWWAGWTLGDTRAALASSGAQQVMISEGAAWMLPTPTEHEQGDDAEVRDAEPREAELGDAELGDAEGRGDEPWVALLPGLDPSVMGWKERAFYLAPGGEAAWDTNGNAGPTIWVDGAVVGAWAQTNSGQIALHSFVDVPAHRWRQIEDRAEQVREWLGETRISWRFPGAINAELIGPR